MQSSWCLLLGVCCPGSPPTSKALNGPASLNGALRNGGQFSRSTRRRSARAVCESPCSLLLREEVSPLPLRSRAQGRWVSFQPQHRSCSLIPCASRGRTWMTQGPLHLQWHGLFSAHPPEPWEAPGCLFALCDRHCSYPSARARGSHAAMPATLSGARAVHSVSHLLHRNVMLQVNSLCTECSLSGDGRRKD